MSLNSLQALLYIVPVILCSLLINIPKWFELELKDMYFIPGVGLVDSNSNTSLQFINSTVDEVEMVTIVDGTWLRYNENYVQYYLHWTCFLTTGVLPLAALFFLNLKIYLRLKEVRKIRGRSARYVP